MHVLIEYIPLVVFLLFYKFADLYWATGSLIITSALQILYYFLKKWHICTRWEYGEASVWWVFKIQRDETP